MGKKILDVGCALGWFLDILKKNKGISFGIDIKESFVRNAFKSGHKVLVSDFPTKIFTNNTFDWVIFNDVFEHIEDLGKAIETTSDLLNEDGMVLILAPNSKSLIYRVSSLLARFGYLNPLERLWLKNYPFPHQTYFTRYNLSILMKQFGFNEIYFTGRSYTSTINFKHLIKIMRIDKSVGLFQALVLTLGFISLRPISKIFGNDSFITVYKKISTK